jgi:glycerol-3-phosphate dehydrogenase
VYYDGQFDDTRLLINLVATAAEQGATLINYVRVVGLTKGADGFITGVVAADEETGQRWTIAARVVINATGAFSDSVRRMAEPDVASLMAPSQGIHLVFHESFLSAESAIMVPHTSDGRVMFAIPWHGHTLVGTTDTPIETRDGRSLSPQATYPRRRPERVRGHPPPRQKWRRQVDGRSVARPHDSLRRLRPVDDHRR